MFDRRLVLGLLIALPLIAFGACLSAEFVTWDDTVLIVQNTWIAGLTPGNIYHAFTSFDPELYVPLTTLSYQLNYAIAGLDPWMYHGTNLALHIANTLLVFAIVRRLARNEVAAIFVAAIFAVHPFNAETVAWASARKDVLSGTFLFGSFLLWLIAQERSERRYLILSIACFAGALLSKVSVIFAPPLFLLVPWLMGERLTMRGAMRTAPFWLLSAIAGAIAFFGKIGQGSILLEKTLIWCASVMFSLWHIIVPYHLSAFYPYTQAVSIQNPDLLFSVIGIILITIVCIASVRWSKWPLFAWAWFIAFLVPSFATLARSQNQLWDIYVGSDRYGYIAALGPLLLLGLCFVWIEHRWSTIAWAGLGVLSILFTGLSIRQTLTWHNSESFFRYSIEASPNSYLAHTNLGTILVQKGDIQGGAMEYGASLAIRPDSITYYDLGLLLEHVKKPDIALQAYQKSVEQSPLQRDAFIRMGALLSQQGDFAEALKALEEALALDPTDETVIRAIEGVKQGKAVLELVEQN